VVYKNLLILLFTFFSVGKTNATISDSIPSDINLLKDTAEIIRIIEYAKEVSKVDKDSASSLFIAAEKASKNSNNEKLIVISLFEHALFLFRNGKHEEAFDKFQETYNKSIQNDFEEYRYKSKVHIGTIYMIKSEYNIATEYMLESLKYFEKQKDYTSASGIYLNLTYIQVEQNDLTTAEEYAKLSYNYAVSAENKKYQSKSLLNIGEIFFLKHEYSDALNYYKKSLKIADSINYNEFKSLIFLNIGGLFKELNQLDSAELYSEKAADFNYKNDASIYTIPKAYLLISEISESKKNYKKAEKYAFKALKFSDSAQVYQISATAYEYLSRIFAKKGDYKTAYEYKVSSAQINDSIFTEEKYKIQNELEAVYENNKKKIKIEKLAKEKEISKQKAQRFEYILFFVLLLITVVIITGSLIFRQNKLNAKNKSIELEQKLLRSQMNPHFIFNSISAIQDFIMNNNPIEASSYLSDFAKLMRAVLINSSDNFISLSNEIETTEYYLKLQRLRLSDKFDYKIIISDEIDAGEYSVPPMLMQPFIENSIIHGIMKKTDGKGLITVSYSAENGFLIMKTQDNGIGRKLSEKYNNSQHKSKAVDITNQRINLLSEKYKQKITFEIIDLTDERNNPSGTLVLFKLPFRKFNNT